MSRFPKVFLAALSLPLLLSACATQPTPSSTLSESEAQAAFIRGCTGKGPREGMAMQKHRTACECGWRVVRRHMSVDEITQLGLKSKETGQPPDSPKFRRAVAEMAECRPQ